MAGVSAAAPTANDAAASMLAADGTSLAGLACVRGLREGERRSSHLGTGTRVALARLNAAKALIEARIRDSEREISAPPAPQDENGVRRESSLIAAHQSGYRAHPLELRSTASLFG